MKSKSRKRQTKRNLARLTNKVEIEFSKWDEEFLSLMNRARNRYGHEFVEPYLNRYYAVWNKEKKYGRRN